MLVFHFVFLLLFHFAASQLFDSKDCQVKQARDQVSKPCQFPFVYKNEIFSGCTDFEDDKGAWCSTNVDPDTREHVDKGGYYGYCSDDCVSAEEAEAIEKRLIDAELSKSTRIRQ